ncbi:hypothetical protein [Yoonia sp. SS1-5]|uniref:Uncharacterized protein n=1 Tax=Yoonia rhodophyticola TaxID=3137370 RepID=A0AAN0M6M9_9RHOB
MPISPPNASVAKELGRKIYLSLLQQVPFVGGPYSAMVDVMRPGDHQVENERWQEEVTAVLNSQEDAIRILTASFPLSDDASYLGKWLCEKSETGGRFDNFDNSQIEAQFQDASSNEIMDAVGELELNGMISVSHALSHRFRSVRPLTKLFEVFDPIVHDVSPRADAVTVAEVILSSEKSQVSASDVEAKFKWSTRRTNPAFSIVGEFIGEGRKSSPLGQPYVYRSMWANSAERASLKRFVSEAHGKP